MVRQVAPPTGESRYTSTLKRVARLDPRLELSRRALRRQTSKHGRFLSREVRNGVSGQATRELTQGSVRGLRLRVREGCAALVYLGGLSGERSLVARWCACFLHKVLLALFPAQGNALDMVHTRQALAAEPSRSSQDAPAAVRRLFGGAQGNEQGTVTSDYDRSYR